mgnify:CR=1 FL=1
MKIKDTVHLHWYKHVLVLILIILCFATSANATGADFGKVFSNSEQVRIFLSKLIHPDFSYMPSLIEPLIKTLKMSILGTILGVLLAIPFSFLATTIVTKNPILTGIVRFFLNVIRTVPNMLLAAILVSMVGIGEATGVLTLTIFTFGLTAQLFYESIETIDTSALEACESVGANKLKTAVWAVWPQMIPSIVSYAFYALEINVRSSTVLGYVGAGGIGVILNTSLGLFKYDRVSLVILMIFVIVMIVDGLSEFIRRKIA